MKVSKVGQIRLSNAIVILAELLAVRGAKKRLDAACKIPHDFVVRRAGITRLQFFRHISPKLKGVETSLH